MYDCYNNKNMKKWSEMLIAILQVKYIELNHLFTQLINFILYGISCTCLCDFYCLNEYMPGLIVLCYFFSFQFYTLESGVSIKTYK